MDDPRLAGLRRDEARNQGVTPFDEAPPEVDEKDLDPEFPDLQLEGDLRAIVGRFEGYLRVIFRKLPDLVVQLGEHEAR